METNDLKQVKYVGPSRLKSLNALGIHTIQQLCETPIEKLAQIPTFGRHFAKLIQGAAREASRRKAGGQDLEIEEGQEKKREKIEGASIRKIEVLKRRLRGLLERWAPPEKKKELKCFDQLKKRSDTLVKHLERLDRMKDGLSKKASEKIVKKADDLNARLKKVGSKIKKKKCKKLACDMQSFSRMLKRVLP
jgi:nucleotidyltransferase/DNA polymerase involved in DNA repair